MSERLAELKALTEVKKEMALAELAPILALERRLRASLKDLRTPRPQPNAGQFPAERSGANENWETWTSERQIELNGRLALVLAEKEALLQSAKYELARHEAVRLLAKAGVKRR